MHTCLLLQVKQRYVKRAKCKRVLRSEIGATALNNLLELFGEGHITVKMADKHQSKKSSQKTLTDTIASARAAKYPAIELYDRLGLHQCLSEAMRAKFRESSVEDINARRKRHLIRVATPLVKVGHLVARAKP